MCLKTTNSERPDITGVARLIADRLVLYIDEQHRAIKPKRTEAKQTGRGQVAYEL